LQQEGGNYFYRIKQTDKDGNMSYSIVMKLENNTTPGATMALFPYPANETTTVSVTLSKAEKIRYRLVDNTGRVLFQNISQLNSGNTLIPLLIKKLSAGMYYVDVIGETFTKQIAFVKK